MSRVYGVAIIGLGAIGRRMLRNMPCNPRLRVVGGWDMSAEARAAAAADFPWLAIAESAEELISADGIDIVYIATPPQAHSGDAKRAIAAGSAVFCEKPLGTDVAASRALVTELEASGLPQAVNLSLAGARGVAHLRAALAEGAPGGLSGLDIRLHFAAWPRAFQASAGWLARREEGGFVREVATHFLYLSEALLGPARLVSADAAYPDDGISAETHALARLDCAGVPVTLAGSVGGAGPDRVEATLWGAARSYRLTDFYRLWQSDGGPWAEVFPEIPDPAEDAYLRQLDELVALMDGQAHALPDVRAALSVQSLIEGILAGRSGD